jgi:hypothetical protein
MTHGSSIRSRRSIVELPARGKPSKYVAGFANFEAVMRYNRSTFCATAVLELADAIRAMRDARARGHRQRRDAAVADVVSAPACRPDCRPRGRP